MTLHQLYQLLIKEDSIDNIELKGDWGDSAKKYGYDKASINILKNPKGLEKIKKKWEKTAFDFDLYFLRSSEGNKSGELGRVSPDFVRDNLKLNIQNDPNKITIIFVNNKGDEKMPMTAWTIAHRLGHALARTHTSHKRFNGTTHHYKELIDTINRLLLTIARTIYNKQSLKKRISSYGDYGGFETDDRKLRNELAHALGTFKSARDKNIRNDAEFTFELIAQYIITGKISLNRNFPRILPISHAWGKPSGPVAKQMTPELTEELDDILSNSENDINNDIDALLGSSIGSIYVM